MNRLFNLLLLLVAAVFTASPTFAQTLEETPQNVIKETSMIVDDGMAMFIVEEERMARVRHIMDYLLQTARNHAAAGEFEAASEALALAASYMYIDTRSTTGDRNQDIERAADHLEKIAALTDYSKTPVDVYDSAIFSAHYALSDFYRQRAETFVNADMEKRAGYALQAALTHYNHAALSWARVIDTDYNVDNDLMNGLNEFATAMKEGQAVNETDAKGLIDRLEKELMKFNDKNSSGLTQN